MRGGFLPAALPVADGRTRTGLSHSPQPLREGARDRVVSVPPPYPDPSPEWSSPFRKTGHAGGVRPPASQPVRITAARAAGGCSWGASWWRNGSGGTRPTAPDPGRTQYPPAPPELLRPRGGGRDAGGATPRAATGAHLRTCGPTPPAARIPGGPDTCTQSAYPPFCKVERGDVKTPFPPAGCPGDFWWRTGERRRSRRGAERRLGGPGNQSPHGHPAADGPSRAAPHTSPRQQR
ncbi:hypothetical protein FHX37_4013 [Haloactinospora alba]|uniref:Uncharacterized protein n=1 Tax=Haloactinospora alba TaxID=405555 RepID=A0A543NA06_9ACTN|nr:hypothetical protein FHX37_4013 [Haloactinospora alba]